MAAPMFSDTSASSFGLLKWVTWRVWVLWLDAFEQRRLPLGQSREHVSLGHQTENGVKMYWIEQVMKRTWKIPEPTKTKTKFRLRMNIIWGYTPPSQPSCIIKAASAEKLCESHFYKKETSPLPGVAIPPAAKLTTGKRLSLAVSFSKWKGAWISLA